MERVVMEPIGIWHTPISQKEDAPLQGIEAGIQGEIELDPRWTEGLRGIKPGAHVWVLSFFNQAQEPRLHIHRRNDETKPKTGLFNSRSPNRPAPVSMTLVEVLSITDNRLDVKGVDALDGTPVLDIKPHIPRLDNPRN